jgi:hypothetical protein
VVEITKPAGIYESGYRGYYADKPDKDTREGLRGYVQAEYVSDDLTKVERTDPADLSKPVRADPRVRQGQARLYTESRRCAGRHSRRFAVPDAARRAEAQGRQRREKDDGPDKPKKPRTDDWWLDAPYNMEWNYRLIPPAGFIPKELPKDATIQIGPALLTEEFFLPARMARCWRIWSSTP